MPRQQNYVQCPVCQAFTPVQVPHKGKATRKIWACKCGRKFSITYDQKRDQFGRIKLLKEVI